MSVIPIPYMLIGFAAAFTIGCAMGIYHEQDAEQARKNKAALIASQEEISRAKKTVDIIGTLAAKPALADTATVAARLRQRADCPRLPSPAADIRPASAGTASDPQADEVAGLAAELKQCVELAERYDALRQTWHANEAAP